MPLYPRERLKRLKNVKKELDDEIEILGQTPLHPRKRLEKIAKMKKIKKELDDKIQFIGQTLPYSRILEKD